MRIAIVNTVPNGSTGRLMMEIANIAREKGGNVVTFSKKWKGEQIQFSNHYYLGSYLTNYFNTFFSRVTGIADVLSIKSTLQLINYIKKNRIDIVHLHNIHGWYMSFPMLFRFLKKENIKVVWTLHDCWAFTGQCPYFTFPECNKWKTGCGGCKRKHEYPSTFVDNTSYMWKKKRKAFLGVNDMTIVTPSKWLKELVEQSFLGEYPVKVINNGIDLSVFKPIQSNFREKYNCNDKIILLGVAFAWERRKGLDVFIDLEKRLGEAYQIVLVGTDDTVASQVPGSIICINKTENQTELAQIYSAADMLINPTREENYPTVNMEAIACGTPVITFKTGGSPEIIGEGTGAVVNVDDLEGLILTIKSTIKNQLRCVEYAKNHFDKNTKLAEYLDVYQI